MSDFSGDDETQMHYLWTCLDTAVGRRDFESASYWYAQIVIHKQRLQAAGDTLPVLEYPT